MPGLFIFSIHIFMTFKEFLQQTEGLFVSDKAAEEGKSRVKKPQIMGPKSVKTYGIAGGPGGYTGGGGGMAAPAMPAQPMK